MFSKKEFLFFAFVEGFTVMAIEIGGSKLIAPFFGSSHIVWTSVLGVTLFALSIGYFWGGSKTDSTKTLKLISNLLWGISLSIPLTLLLTHKAYSFFIDIDINLATIFFTIFLIAPTLILLGSIPPLLIKISTPIFGKEKVSGMIFSISTLGGIVSSYLFGFFIIPSFGVSNSYIIISICIALLAVLFSKKSETKFSYKLGTVLFFLIAVMYNYHKKEKDNGRTKLVYSSEGIYGQLKVVDNYLDAQNQGRFLLMNSIPQTYIIKRQINSYSLFHYVHLIGAVSSLAPKGSDALLCGMGGGSNIKELLKRNMKIDVIDLDPRMKEITSKYFFVNTNSVNFILDDAKHYVLKSDKKYDLIVMDLLNGEVQPSYMFSVENFSRMKMLLKDKGILIVNFQSAVNGEEGVGLRSVFKTLLESGFKAKLWSTNPDAMSDVIFIASTQPLNENEFKLDSLNDCCKINVQVQNYFNGKVKFIESPDLTDAMVLRDDKPFLDILNAQLISDYRDGALQSYLASEIKYEHKIFK